MNPVDVPSPVSNPSHVRPPAAALNLRFSVRTLLVMVAVASLLFAAATWIGSIWSVSISLLALIVGAHVFGNAIGTRLRKHANEQILSGGPDYDEMRWRFQARVGDAASDHAMLKYQPPGRLMSRDSLGRLPRIMVILGGVAGGGFATLSTHYFFRDFNIGDRLIAIGSFAVLGALAGFVISTFVQVALWPALRYYFCRGARQRLEESGSLTIKARSASEWVGARTPVELPRDVDAC